MDAAEKERLSGLYDERLASQDTNGYVIRWRTMAAKILTHGGELVVPPLSHEELVVELASGEYRDGAKAALVLGVPCGCHDNVEELLKAKVIETIMTGYALSEDGLWHQHSWGALPWGLVETTVKRVGYFGVPGKP